MKPKNGFCINCDNRHGCKSGTPPCINEMGKMNISGMTGKRYFMEANKIDKCRECHFFRICWKMGEYSRLTKNTGANR